VVGIHVAGDEASVVPNFEGELGKSIQPNAIIEYKTKFSYKSYSLYIP